MISDHLAQLIIQEVTDKTSVIFTKEKVDRDNCVHDLSKIEWKLKVGSNHGSHGECKREEKREKQKNLVLNRNESLYKTPKNQLQNYLATTYFQNYFLINGSNINNTGINVINGSNISNTGINVINSSNISNTRINVINGSNINNTGISVINGSNINNTGINVINSSNINNTGINVINGSNISNRNQRN